MSLKSWLAGIFASVVLIASTAGTVTAQPPGGGRGPGGPGGMRGGMMMGGGGGAMSILNMLRNEKIQGELKISDDEKAALEKIGEKLRELMAPPGGGGGPGNFRDMSEEEREKMMKEMQDRMKKANDVVREEIESILPPDKLSRLVGIFIQNNGMQTVLSNPMVTDELEFTDEQKEKVTKTGTEVMEEMRNAMGELFAPGADRTQLQAKMEEFRKKSDEKFATILTDSQKKKLDEMKGAEFKLSPEEMGRGMFGGGRAGRGGPGGEGGPGGGRQRGQRPTSEGGNNN